MKQLFAAVAAAMAFALAPTAQAAPTTAPTLQSAVYHPDGKAQLTTVRWHRHRHHRRHRH